MRKRILGSVALTAVLLIGFQNCGKLSFSTDSNSSKTGVGAQGDTAAGDGTGTGSGTGGTGGNTGTGGTGNGGTGGTAGTGNNGTGGTNVGVANQPSISITADLPVLKGKDAKLAIVTKYVDAVTYSCLSQSDQRIIRRGQVTLVDGIASLVIPVDQDVSCTFLAVSGDKSATTIYGIPVDCGDALYKDEVAHVCRADFDCKSVVLLKPTPGNALKIPKRTTDGVCYAYKMMDGLALGPSAGDKDTDLIARDHGAKGIVNNPPYKMGSMVGSFQIDGTRHVSVGSDVAGKEKVGVDNFLLIGLSPVSLGNPQDYQVAGTADASAYIKVNGELVDTNSVHMKNEPIAVHAFAAGGTASFDPIEVTSAAKSGVKYGFDIRALDCGGSRYLSPLYLLFH